MKPAHLAHSPPRLSNQPVADRLVLAAPLAAILLSLTGCRAIEGIFKAGLLAGVIVVIFVALLGFGAARLLRRGT
jgi:hypothetical protein